MVLQTDGEPAIKSWADDVQREWSKGSQEIQTQLMTRTSPAGSHQSNGMAENTVRRVEGIVRTIKATLERVFKMTLTPKSPILPWVVRHGVFLLNRYAVKTVGRTPYEELHISSVRAPWPGESWTTRAS